MFVTVIIYESNRLSAMNRLISEPHRVTIRHSFIHCMQISQIQILTSWACCKSSTSWTSSCFQVNLQHSEHRFVSIYTLTSWASFCFLFNFKRFWCLCYVLYYNNFCYKHYCWKNGILHIFLRAAKAPMIGLLMKRSTRSNEHRLRINANDCWLMDAKNNMEMQY